MASSAIDALAAELQATPRRWLVTGAAGFIGSHLVERLLQLGQEVVGLDNFSTGRRSNLDDVRARVGDDAWARFTLIAADVCDPAACRAAAEGAQHVLHQAALGSVPRSILEPVASFAANVEGLVHVLEAARAASCRSVVYASSSSVYGDHPALPKREHELGLPLSPYAATKRCDEVLAAAWSRSYALPITGLRYFNVVGPRQDPEGAYAAVVPRWIAELAAGRAPTIFGDGETSRDFCPVANVVQANLLAAASPPGMGDGEAVFNIALGGRTTLNELFQLLRDGMAALGSPCAGLTAQYEDFRPGDIRHSLADIDRARSQLGYAPEVGLAEALQETMAWFRDQLAGPQRRA